MARLQTTSSVRFGVTVLFRSSTCTKTKQGVFHPFSDFIRNASSKEKKVYKVVLVKATERQKSIIEKRRAEHCASPRTRQPASLHAENLLVEEQQVFGLGAGGHRQAEHGDGESQHHTST